MKSYILLLLLIGCGMAAFAQQKPNVIFILVDDLGYGDLSCYGSKILKTPNIDRLAESGIQFSNGHAVSSTCTPSRYAALTGRYPWKQAGTGVLPGDARLIIPQDWFTLPRVFKLAGYQTAIVGKWHLGLGNQVEKNWNVTVKPGPNELGFDYSYIFPATADRVPTVFMENGLVTGADSNDPIMVSYGQKVGNDPTGAEHPELLKMKASPGQGHNNTIVNGIGRIGFMSGGHQARWTDEELSYTFLDKANRFIRAHARQPFFLYFTPTEPHVPRMPATQFKGKSGLGYRGDAILQLDWTVGELMKTLEASGIARNTMIIFTSDNGPVLDDGYQDGATEGYHGEQLGGLRGGKYSKLEGGTRVPFIMSWPKAVSPGHSDALVSQIDLVASFSSLLGQSLPAGAAPDSEDHLDALLGKSKQGRVLLFKGSTYQNITVTRGDWKYIAPDDGAAFAELVGIETGNNRDPQLYNLRTDPGEKNNLASSYPDMVKEMHQLLQSQKR